MGFNLNKKQNIIWLVVIVSFLICGLFTIAGALLDDESSDTNTEPEIEKTSSKDSTQTKSHITITEASTEDPYKELVAAFSQLAVTMADHLAKGARIGITGKLHPKRWTDKAGHRRFDLEVIVDKMDFLSPKKSDSKVSPINW